MLTYTVIFKVDFVDQKGVLKGDQQGDLQYGKQGDPHRKLTSKVIYNAINKIALTPYEVWGYFYVF